MNTLMPLATYGAEFSPVALELPVVLSQDEWEEIGKGIVRITESTQWWLGDWWSHVERREKGEQWSGRRKALVESESWNGPAFAQCASMGTTCRAFSSLERSKLLSFGHHHALAKYTSTHPAMVRKLLDWCEEPLRKGGTKPRSIKDLQEKLVDEHNQLLFKNAVQSIEFYLGPCEKVIGKDDVKRVGNAIKAALLGCLKFHQAEKTSLTEVELQQIIHETIEGEVPAIAEESGDVKMYIDFIGPINLISSRQWHFDQMAKAQSEQTLGGNITSCKKAISQIETFLTRLQQRFPNGQ